MTLNKNYKINDFGNFPRSQIKGFATTACFCVTVIQNYKKNYKTLVTVNQNMKSVVFAVTVIQNYKKL